MDPEGSGEVEVELEIEQEHEIDHDGAGVSIRVGTTILRYEGLWAWDALGRVLPSWIAERTSGIALVIDDTDAVWPLTIDPVLTTVAWTAESNQPGSFYGVAVAGGGDVNGDGYGDLLVGAPYFDNGINEEGMALLYLGSSTGLATVAAWTAESDQNVAYFGTSLSSAGDINSDGFGDVIVGAYQYTNGQNNEGRAFLFLGSATGLGTSAAWTADSDQLSGQMGRSVAGAGDVNNDGYSDVIVGADRFDSATTDEGRAFVYAGSASGLGTTALWSAIGGQISGYFGLMVAGPGDVNGDGFADVLVGAPFQDNGQLDEGRAYLYFGSGTGPSAIPSWTAEGNQADANYATSLSGAGDTNGDGYADLLVGAYLLDNGQTSEGAAFVHFGGPATPTTTANWRY